MKNLVFGILAHVDAGKTTLAESMLYLTGSIRRMGRVDHRDAFLDNYEQERLRGITIFSKQAVIKHKECSITLLDTPGHVDFSAEMERALQVLDYAILVISGSEGVQGHTETLWRLLARYQIPTFLFINKMDMQGTNSERLMDELRRRLNSGCVDFSQGRNLKHLMEDVAVCDEALLEKYLDSGVIRREDIRTLIGERRVFPCYFGSALRLSGVEEFLDGLDSYTQAPIYKESFAAKIYKIARDEQGNRLTYMKITGGELKVKMPLTNQKENKSTGLEDVTGRVDRLRRHNNMSITEDIWEEKVDQIRIYSGVKYETVDQAAAGTVCAVTGLTMTYAGEGLGVEEESDLPILSPVLSYQIILPDGCDPFSMLARLRQLEEEDPQLHIMWSEQYKQLFIQLMGEVQIEVLKKQIFNRFGVEVEFGIGKIVYKETILSPVIGVGHFEPLRHYAEVHLMLEPDEPGSGLSFTTICDEELLDRSWQRLILTHLEEKEHLGVMTGSPITDMRITLIAGRAHQKHTEGGDFRQATYRAVRQGLKEAKSILLEPFYQFRLEIPAETVGRAMSDLQRKHGSFQPPDIIGDRAILKGYAPVEALWGYQTEVTAYTGGRGSMECTLKGYLPCHNTEEVITAISYDSERDMDNPTGSVFCSHGAGFTVAWNQVKDYMHIDSSRLLPKQPVDNRSDDYMLSMSKGSEKKAPSRATSHSSGSIQEDKELEEIFIRTFGPIKQRLSYSAGGLGYERKTLSEEDIINNRKATDKKEAVKEYLLVDGYNIIFSWEELSELAKTNLDAARNKLMDILCNYQGFKKSIVILVFDAYKVKGGVGEVMDYHNIHVVFTKEAETADEYIEKVTHDIAKKHKVTVATSDFLEQMIILGQGATRLSATDLKEEIKRIEEMIRQDYLEAQPSGRSYLGELL